MLPSATKRLRRDNGARIPRLAHSGRSHAHQFTVAQSAAIRHSEAARKRRGVHSISLANRGGDSGGGVLAVGQLLVAGAGGRAGGRLTRGGGRVHARVAPALRGGAGEPLRRGLAVAGAAAAGTAARARLPARRAPPVPRRLPAAALRHETSAAFLTAAVSSLLRAPKS
ncbi:uncharacterized protein LOC123871773 isoform X2 [Maniola jurtina]|uniref:uncharacterized protein LOC123871773 isoform X2 n=1 Tax=Maniola jurtina TaxID=191418 RepID=UPI001E68BDDF|nr:uncharacterized protein LOC123871773 isoform X2 [Maniola jurtina]